MEEKFAKVRRKNREITDNKWIDEKLNDFHYGVISTSVENQPFINWNLFVYIKDENAVYFHTGKGGRTQQNIELNPRVCFSIAEIGQLIRAKEAKNFSTQYSSVVVFGCVEIISEDTKKFEILQKFIEKYFPDLTKDDYEPFTKSDGDKATVYKINIEKITVKQNKDDVNMYL